MLTQPDFYQAVLDALDNQIAVIDAHGEIVYVNNVWVDFGVSNGMPRQFTWTGKNYLNVCGVDSEELNAALETTVLGIRQVLSGAVDVFEADYPCHSPTERRWFMMRIAAMPYPGDRKLWVVSHTNITARKLAEETVERLSITDPLTGLANRRRLDLFLSDEWQRALRHRNAISVVVLDIDHFKVVNDTRGHAFGDECLRQVAGILHRFTQRPSDLATRFGGEEFVLVLGNTTPDDARALANRVREAVAQLALTYANQQHLTLSAGVSSTTPHQPGDGACLVEWADAALYEAKKKGRNRVELAPLRSS